MEGVKGTGARGLCSPPGGDFILLFSKQLFPFCIRLLDFFYNYDAILLGIINLDRVNVCTSLSVLQIGYVTA